MRLADWMDKNNLSQKEIGDLIDVKQSSVSRWVNGVMRPSLSKIKEIIVLTNGEVSFEDFC
ncbi:helix-turn-helix domain-containing protein [Commensalibacter nepenthis]|uniref:Helix-turn-helix transcriptional regulator n=1 Tax=Commensalibacter nepenthis TaxID=3043872 RepID=A0ABT6Q821_9PROT|nr:helix-turn-helix transcriptional regulator [Commensalibacter sp. TBRC 10068]MDI2113046.1 helix-turn-helix transcriptional regulator [Commensalibacter sp. TBRC 10068]